jgi:hypothetical protein
VHRRQAILDAYEHEIEALYDLVDRSVLAQTDVPPPKEWTREKTRGFVGAVVRRVLDKEDSQKCAGGGKEGGVGAGLGDDTDMFGYGLDSLGATWVRNSILKALQAGSGGDESNGQGHQLDVRGVPSGFVYAHPTIGELAEYVYGLVHANEAGERNGVNGVNGEGKEKEKEERMWEMVKKYTQDLPSSTSSQTKTNGHHTTNTNGNGHDVKTNGNKTNGHTRNTNANGKVVLLTGTTGGLGANILASLIGDEAVSRVYALNRPSKGGEGLGERQRGAFVERGLEGYVSVLEDSQDGDGGGKVVLLEGDTGVVGFGLEERLVDEVGFDWFSCS